jgi:hypothetical protein
MTQLLSKRQTAEPNLKLLKVHRREESQALSGADPGPAGFDFVLRDDDFGAESLRALLSQGLAGRRVWRQAAGE